ncbi:cyclic nucleotide-binding/CBS domain-containing protein [Alienimonas chondri]|uniref:CBS domain-containing protein n=1 Tax=Alienimonas chondri TaxID=2681879 RepID=A0ABX1VFN0_9PLAN|nr:CBS domain-containing protein [Alienimonas chondri]NNJ26072.1 hypothetical protein [Alienimonas chondri]
MTAATPDSALPTGDPWISVREVMSPPGPTLSAGASLWNAVDAALREGVDRIWVTDPDGRLAGEVTNATLLRQEVCRAPGERLLASLSTPVTPVDEFSDAGAAVVRLGRGQASRLPVTRDGILVGELTRNDALSLVNGIRRIANAVQVQLTPPPATAPAESVGPAAPRFLTQRAGLRARQGNS